MEIGPSDYPHLLEWHSSHCISLADSCTQPHVKKILRLLAVDLTLEAQLLRRVMQKPQRPSKASHTLGAFPERAHNRPEVR